MELGYLLINGLGGPFVCHMGHIGLGPHPKSKQALTATANKVLLLRSYFTWLGFWGRLTKKPSAIPYVAGLTNHHVVDWGRLARCLDLGSGPLGTKANMSHVASLLYLPTGQPTYRKAHLHPARDRATEKLTWMDEMEDCKGWNWLKLLTYLPQLFGKNRQLVKNGLVEY